MRWAGFSDRARRQRFAGHARRRLTRKSAAPAARAAAPTGSSNATARPVKVTYQVKRGDTLSAVAKHYGTTVASLKAWNGLNGDRLMPGSRLTVYTPREGRQRQP